jgi:glycosyltransferase involved in cell wall biosynthesis
MNIMFLSHTYWESVFRVGSHHLAAHMASLGHNIFYISTPVSPAHYLKYNSQRHKIDHAGQVRKPIQNITTLIPFTPVPAGIIVSSGIDAAFSFGKLRSGGYSPRITETYDLIFIDDPKFAGLLRHLSWRKLVYRPTDVYAKMGLKNWEKLENMILEKCDSIIATAEPVAAFMRDHFSAKQPTLVQVNGVDFNLFSVPQKKPDEFPDNDRKRCVYVGALDFRFDFDAVQLLAQQHSSVDFYIIGPCGEDAKKAHSLDLGNLHFLGSRPHASIPAYLQHADVGLLPLKPIPANAGRSPMKIYEYLAAGLPVVALETDELARRNTPRVFRYDGSEALNTALAAALLSPKETYIDEKVSWHSITDRVLKFALQ